MTGSTLNRFTTPWGEFGLTRFPEDPRDRLRAWDAADEYLLRRLAGDPGPEGEPVQPVDTTGHVTVFGDRWGALVTALASARTASATSGQLTQITDSYLTQQATWSNLARSGNPADAARLLSTQDEPPARIDLLLVRVPKSLALLEDQLHRLAPSLHEGSVIIGTGMVKEIHTSTLTLFTDILGPTRTSLAAKKARLVFSTPTPSAGPQGDVHRQSNRWPGTYTLGEDATAAAGVTVTQHAGVFCADRLDIGTRFLLAHLPRSRGDERVVDLGCGNGVVGTALALANPEAELLFTDESYQAVASAKATYEANVTPGRRVEFLVGDALATVAPGSVDLVVNNPPFHSHQATTDTTAWRMFSDARRALRPGGELWIIGNRHLGYHLKLRRLFGNCELIAGDSKFVVLRAAKRS
ncbi:methyltransferase [Streptomyces sp. NPDC006879]|uniref:methyltransferase n=1 Tax=Streptomyces sp. NPDC006879 TaxID=3364767 RepID=UPI00369CB7B0